MKPRGRRERRKREGASARGRFRVFKRIKRACVRMAAFARKEQVRRAALGWLFVLLLGFGMLGGSVLAVSGAVKRTGRARVYAPDEISLLEGEFDCVLVLGCRVYADGRMSDMLTDRVLTGIEVIESGACDTLLMSGDHRTDAYDEPSAMKAFAVKKGIPSSRVFLDHDGYSTYDSIARYKEIYGGGRVVIVTQEYHLYRALYLADKLGIDAVGVSADRRGYARQGEREIREILARCKDVYLGLAQPDPEVLGDAVLLSSNGDASAEARPILP